MAGTSRPRSHGICGEIEKYPVDIVKWEADGSLRAFKGTGWDQDFEERDDYTENSKLLIAEWKDGLWTLISVQWPLKGGLRRRHLL